jgi:hypothetical protein
MQSVPIVTDVVRSNLDQGEVYNIMWSLSATNKNLPPRYNWNIVESGVKHHQTNINVYVGWLQGNTYAYMQIVLRSENQT